VHPELVVVSVVVVVTEVVATVVAAMTAEGSVVYLGQRSGREESRPHSPLPHQ
jgi:hypothetical protein